MFLRIILNTRKYKLSFRIRRLPHQKITILLQKLLSVCSTNLSVEPDLVLEFGEMFFDCPNGRNLVMCKWFYVTTKQKKSNTDVYSTELLTHIKHVPLLKGHVVVDVIVVRSIEDRYIRIEVY
jgi:hypothetical protein